jgi:hypothetical protein
VTGGRNPGLLGERNGSIILSEPEDVPVTSIIAVIAVNNLRPVQIERAVASKIEPVLEGQDVPLVKSSVIGWRKPGKRRES